MIRSRILGVVLTVAAPATACGGSGSVPEDAVPATVDVAPAACTADPIRSSARDVDASGLAWLFGEEFPETFAEPILPRSRIVPVLGADGIPAVDAPKCLPAAGVGFLSDSAPVVVLDVNGDVRAYPLEILTWHELVNDTVGGLPVTISYCPLWSA